MGVQPTVWHMESCGCASKFSGCASIFWPCSSGGHFFFQTIGAWGWKTCWENLEFTRPGKLTVCYWKWWFSIAKCQFTLWLSNIAMERSTIFNRQTIYKWAIFHGYVKSPEGTRWYYVYHLPMKLMVIALCESWQWNFQAACRQHSKTQMPWGLESHSFKQTHIITYHPFISIYIMIYDDIPQFQWYITFMMNHHISSHIISEFATG